MKAIFRKNSSLDLLMKKIELLIKSFNLIIKRCCLIVSSVEKIQRVKLKSCKTKTQENNGYIKLCC